MSKSLENFVREVKARKGLPWCASDLDGTLLGMNSRLLAGDYEKLTNLLNKGFPFTVASARSLQGIKEVLGNLPFNLPIIQKNGASLSDYATEERIEKYPMLTEHYRQVLKILFQFDVAQIVITGICSADDDGKIFYLPQEFKNKELDGRDIFLRKDLEFTTASLPLQGRTKLYFQNALTHRDFRFHFCKKLELLENHFILGITFFEKPEVISALCSFLQLNAPLAEALNVYPMYVGDDGLQRITIQSKSASKAIGLVKIAKMNDLKMEDCIAFGDNSNDADMLQQVGYGVAMENGKEELKKIANEVIGKNVDGAVVSTMEKIFDYTQ